ncbi:TPA: hypothetical protein WH558_000628 [Neisseria meningitidis]|uniref:hypothetical protein n=1 Tax=Neisseria meningitidis TaxID=487 RepID=UPI0009B672CD|nr:hypothetical protein [Neisseria meningitidis]ARB72058.1 hypothetical protein A6J54_10720 [Neisseria meningitidis]ARC09028.1 hypothetical protein A6J50_00050 [Neisseria meningitidis]VEJ39476.1 integral membrane protein [Neisseria meningitidis]
MKKQITAAVMMLSMIAPAMANSMDNQTFENQVFHTQADAPVQLAELSQKEMKETEGAAAPLVAIGILHAGRFLAQRWVTQRVAAQALSRGANVYARTSQQARAVANQAWGRQNVIRHGQKEIHSNYSHFQNSSQKIRGHAFYGNKHR